MLFETRLSFRKFIKMSSGSDLWESECKLPKITLKTKEIVNHVLSEKLKFEKFSVHKEKLF